MKRFERQWPAAKGPGHKQITVPGGAGFGPPQLPAQSDHKMQRIHI
jgi:hypothetical protein